jgi:hypothetical protein
MEIAIIFLLNAIAGGAVGHYVSKGLGKIDKKLVDLMEKGTDPSTISKYITDRGIEKEVTEFADNTIRSSIVLPMISSDTATVHDKSELFLNFLKVGYQLSNSIKVDLMLPSSLIMKQSFTLFTRNEEVVPKLKRDGVTVNIIDAQSSPSKNKLYIFPVSSDDEKNDLWRQYKESLSQGRAESDNYLATSNEFYYLDRHIDKCNVSRITAGSCYFSLFSSMDAEKREMLNLETGYGKVNLANWSEGIKEMTEGMQEILSLLVLPEKELVEIRNSYELLKNVIDAHLQ